MDLCGQKQNKVCLIDVSDRETNEMVAYVWGKRDLATAQKLKEHLRALGITDDSIACDSWEIFLTAFKDCLKQVGKRFTVEIESHHKRLSNLSRRVFWKNLFF